MKKSTAVTLIISGALLSGCNRPNSSYTPYADNGQPITNNTYAAGYGYWHAPYSGWYPFPYNYYRPGFGYYHGGLYSPTPEVSPIASSAPRASSWGGFHGGRFGGGTAESGHGGVSRGGFGHSAGGGE